MIEVLPEANERQSEGQVNRAGRAEQVELQPEQRQETRQRRDEGRHSDAVEEQRVERAHGGAERERHEDGAGHRPAEIDPEHAQDRRGEARHGADRQVDLAQQQHADDAERDDPDGGAVVEQVREIAGPHEDRVQRS